jgi:DNA-binding transcriptional LysR family regulator
VPLNPHHLEIFYHVALHRGISAAARRMPYGIQQPAVSGQMRELERTLGATLFERSPFRLTAEGEELYAYVRDFFRGLPEVEARLRGGLRPVLRVGAAEPVLRDHLPEVLGRLRAFHPDLRLSLKSGYQDQLETWLAERAIDLAITVLESRPPKTLRCRPLVSLPLVLLVPARGGPRRAEDVWGAAAGAATLIAPPPEETVSRLFQRGLKERGVTWPAGLAASSLETVAKLVAAGYGVGVSVASAVTRRGVRELPLAGFPEVRFAALWARGAPPAAEACVRLLEEYVAERWPARAGHPLSP